MYVLSVCVRPSVATVCVSFVGVCVCVCVCFVGVCATVSVCFVCALCVCVRVCVRVCVLLNTKDAQRTRKRVWAMRQRHACRFEESKVQKQPRYSRLGANKAGTTANEAKRQGSGGACDRRQSDSRTGWRPCKVLRCTGNGEGQVRLSDLQRTTNERKCVAVAVSVHCSPPVPFFPSTPRSLCRRPRRLVETFFTMPGCLCSHHVAAKGRQRRRARERGGRRLPQEDACASDANEENVLLNRKAQSSAPTS